MKLKLDGGWHRHFARIGCLVLSMFSWCLPLQGAEARTFQGIDLDNVRQVQGLRAMREVYELDPATRRYRLVDTVIQLPLEGAWITYNPTRNVFYLNKVPGENEATYFGAIEGDPFDKFKLEEKMISKLRKEYAPDEQYRLRLMVRSGHPKLRERALRIVTAALAPDVSERVRALNVDEFRKVTDGLKGEDVAPVLAAIQQTEKEIEEQRPVIPDDHYLPGNDALAKQGKLKDWMKPPVAVPESAWGAPLDGLRAAAVFSSVTPEVGAKIEVWLMVENVSDHAIKFSSHDVIQTARAVVKRADGSEVKVTSTWATGLSPIYRHKLQPKERLTLAKKSLVFEDVQGWEGIGFGGGRAVAGAGEYQVRYDSVLGGTGGWAKGEWSGSLVTGETKITVASKTAAITAPATKRLGN